MLNVGRPGAGCIAGVHATAISSHPGSRLAAVSDIGPENAERLASRHGCAALKAAADRGEIGRVELLSITSFDPAPPPMAYFKVSGGIFHDMTIHDFDMSNVRMGAVPASVSAAASSIVDPAIGAAGDVDAAVVTLSHADGRIAVIRNSRRAV